MLAASKAQGTQAGGEARLPWVSEHPNSPKTSGLLMAATHPGWQRQREEFLHSEMTEMQAKGTSFPQGGKCSESSGVGSDTAFRGCPFASSWRWLLHSWIKLTAKGLSIPSASLLIIANPKKLYIHKTISAPLKAFQHRLGLEPCGGLCPGG